MKVGRSEAVATITPVHWRKMAEESRLGCPMLCERTVAECGKAVEAQKPREVLTGSSDPALAEPVAGIHQGRASSLLALLS